MGEFHHWFLSWPAADVEAVMIAPQARPAGPVTGAQARGPFKCDFLVILVIYNGFIVIYHDL